MFYDLTIGAAVSAALIPTLSEIVERDDRESLWDTFGTVLVLAWLTLTGVVVLLELATRPLMTAILRGFHNPLRAQALTQAVDIAHLLIPSLLFLGTSAVFLSVLYSLRRFTAPAFATSLYHLGIILGAITLSRPLGILALPVGAVGGAAAQVCSQIPALLRARPRLASRPRITPEVRRIVWLYLPVALGLVVSIVGQVVDIQFKWELKASSVTAMQIATTLTQFPIGIAVAALTYAVLPSISVDAAENRIAEFKDTLASGIRFVLFLTIPAAVGYLVLAVPIITLLFQHGRFTPDDGHRTVLALAGYAVQIPFVGLDQLLIFSFYARKNTVTPMLVGVAGVCIYIFSALILMPRLQVLGLALANTIQNSLHAVILLVIMFATLGTLSGRGVLRSVAISLVASLAMAGAAALAAAVVVSVFGVHQILARAVDVIVPVGLGASVYVGAAFILRRGELATALSTAAKLRQRALGSS